MGTLLVVEPPGTPIAAVNLMSIVVLGRVLDEAGAGDSEIEGVREVSGTVLGPVPTEGRVGPAMLRAARVSCRATGNIASAADCVQCRRFINYRPSDDRAHVTIRCLWSGDDSVSDLMTPRSKLVALSRDALAEDGRRLAGDYNLKYLLVVDGEALVGLVRRDLLEWADPKRPVSTLVDRRVWVTAADATLADAVGMLNSDQADCVIVAADGDMLGMLTRDDLRDVGCM